VGSLLTVSDGDLILTAVVALVVVGVMAALHKELVLGAFDREGAAALGFRPLWLDLAVLTLVAITVVTAVPAVGTILVVALLVTPALTARLWTDRIASMMALGAALGALSGFVGLWVATQARIAAGASVVLVASALLALSLAATGARRLAV
jgi:ABC-type Mn2+/Zn2+ transport system permease subunit